MKANDINKIEDFGQKIGGARKDYYTEAREATGGGCSTMAVYPTYCAALEVLTSFLPGAQLIAQPAA